MNSMNSNYLHIGVISNIILDIYIKPIIMSYFGNNTVLYHIPYNEQDNNKYRKLFNELNLIIVWLDIETSNPNIYRTLFYPSVANADIVDDAVTLCTKLYADISAHPGICILWFSFEDYFTKLPSVIGHQYSSLVDEINAKLSNILKYDVCFIDLKRIIAEVGIDNTYDPKGKYRWNAPYSKMLIEAAVKEMYKQYLIERGITKKCLVLDCDNVLWGGILSEDGIENIKLGESGFGRPYQDFQRFVLSLYYHGVILAICSKNDLSDVMTMFHEHSEMILKEENIAYFQVNWENKPDNIKRIAESLNVSLDSMVFIDDSPVEIDAVKSILPEVRTILYERDSVYDKLSCFNLKSNINIADIEKRNETYRTNQSREALKSQYNNYDEYITDLEITIDIHEALPVEYSRISELTQRTNKCTNGKRYTVAEIKERVTHENVKLYSVSVCDRFSDLGLVGVLEVERNSLTLFSLSCRALGRWIENKLLAFIASKYHIRNIEFNPTGKNGDVKALFSKYFISATFSNYA